MNKWKKDDDKIWISSTFPIPIIGLCADICSIKLKWYDQSSWSFDINIPEKNNKFTNIIFVRFFLFLLKLKNINPTKRTIKLI